MKIGIIADSHDRLTKVRKAVEILGRENIDLLLHAGDIIAPFVVPLLAELNVPVYAVFGNNDGEKQGLKEAFEKNGFTISEPPFRFTFQKTNILLFHELHEFAEGADNLDLVVYGHTHEPHIEKKHPLLVNPGELCGWVNGRSTFMIFNTKEGKPILKEV